MLKRLLIFIFSLSCFCCGDDSPPDDICGDLKQEHYAIINGEESFDPDIIQLTEAQVLAIGAIIKLNWWEVSSCTGTLITDRIVITAAHCIIENGIIDVEPSEIKFIVGDNILFPTYLFGVQEIHNNPDYQSGNPSSDFAVIILEKSAFEALDTRISPIPLNDETLPSNFNDTKVQNVGYGKTSVDNSSFLNKNTRRWWNVEQVTSLYDNYYVVNGNGTTGMCFGDSGSPSLWTFPDHNVRIAGILSNGDENCLGNDNFARVDESYSWIKQYLDTFDTCKGLTYHGTCSDNITAKWCEDGQIIEDSCETYGNDFICNLDINNNHRCVNACGGNTLEGICNGNIATWCEGTEIKNVDCAASDMICAQNSEGKYRCANSDPCLGISYQGYCNSDTAVWCENAEIKSIYCTSGMICAQNNDANYRCVENVDPCNGVSYEGYCIDQTAVWCDMSYLSNINCEDYDLLCGLDQDGRYRCLTEEEMCGGVTEQGYCDGNTAVWCNRHVVTNLNCEDYGMICAKNNNDNYRCLDNCNNVSFEGHCENNVAIWCENDSLQEQDCTQINQVCGDVDGNYRCKSQANDPCQGLTYQGICTDDNKVQWCEDGHIKTRDCTVCNQTCSWIDDIIGNYCM